MSLFLGPLGVNASANLIADQRNRTDFETLQPARFNDLDSGKGVSYAESISKDKQLLNRVFIAELAVEDAQDQTPSILVAESGQTVVDTEFGQKFLLLKNGKRYKGQPGETGYEVVTFKEYFQQLPEPDYVISNRKETDGMSTLALYEDDSPMAAAALQWRFSLPVLVMVVGFLAIPFSRTTARRGRYNKLLPAILVYTVYLVSLNAARGVSDEADAAIPGLLWWVHVAFFCFALLLYAGPQWVFRLRPARS